MVPELSAEADPKRVIAPLRAPAEMLFRAPLSIHLN